jgi:exosortase
VNPLSRFALFFLPVLLGYAATLVWVFDSWMLPESYYSHGPVLPLVAAAVLWARRRDWAAAPACVDTRGWWLLGAGLLVHLCGAALMIDSLSAASLVLSVPGAVWVAVGAARVRRLWPVLLLLVFAVPLPIFMTGRIAFELKEVAMNLSLSLNDLLGLDTVRRGADLFVAPHPEPLEVADACSGLRSLIALTTLGYCVAFFLGAQTGIRRWVLLLSAVPIAVVTNVVRISAICWAARSQGVVWASTTGHEILRWAAWLVALALLLALDRLLTRGRAGARP